MIKSTVLVLAVAVAAAVAVPAAAQETFVPNRFSLFNGEMSTEAGKTIKIPILLDTEFGRTWTLVEKNGKWVWDRILLNKLGTLPGDLLGLPASVAPTTTPTK